MGARSKYSNKSSTPEARIRVGVLEVAARLQIGSAGMGTPTDRYAQRAFDFFERVSVMTDPDVLGSAIAAEMKQFGFEWVTVWTVPPPGTPLKAILLNTRPEDYVQNYVEKNHVLKDPAVTYLRRSIRPYSWGDVRKSIELSPIERRIMDEGREFDAHDGLIIPIVTATGSLSVVSPCGRDPDLSPRSRAAIELISVIGEQALKRAILGKHRSNLSYQTLTGREREIMQHVAWGKTDSEIGTILGISSSTVLKHVDNAKQKLGALRRSSAVVIAMSRGEISI
jgi:LuxR family transcriptional regulator, quorum-sensing system regulator BjaR1